MPIPRSLPIRKFYPDTGLLCSSLQQQNAALTPSREPLKEILSGANRPSCAVYKASMIIRLHVINEKSLKDHFEFIHLFKKQVNHPFLVTLRHSNPLPAVKEALTKSYPKGLNLESFILILFVLLKGSSDHQDRARGQQKQLERAPVRPCGACVYVHVHVCVRVCVHVCA